MTEVQPPIAIIGIGCRFPGRCNDPESFWNLLKSGRDAISLTPPNRWNVDQFYSPDQARPGKTQSRWGGYVDDIDRFDPQLFGISPREAASMDPQQRMLLETSYRAIEDAGLPLDSLAGESVSVYVGVASIDYAVASLSFRDRGVIGPYSNTGVSSSIAANRISYCFDLRGESVAIDTACSSSLIAAHLACRSLRQGSSKMALVGGVNALLLPDFFVAFSQLGVLSPDGRCRTFDASASGYVRSEGAGVVLLKRLDDALADGDSIYATIRGTSSNQDGRTEGMTVPSEVAQTELIRSAIRSAEVDSKSVSYVEAHGTGTPIGDPIEARAIAACYGSGADGTCHIGSVKTNIGHLEAGAGIASIIKVALALKHQTIPAHLHFKTPNPKIDLDSSGLIVPTESRPWETSRERLAAINGFGYGGANAHLILGEVIDASTRSESPVPLRIAEAQEPPQVSSTPILLPITAHDRTSLMKTAQAWADWLESTDVSEASIAAAAALQRTHHRYRASVIGANRHEWMERLRSLAADPDHELVSPVDSHFSASDRGKPPSIAFVCSGQGPQWWAMGRRLLKSDSVFREAISRCDCEFQRHVFWSLTEELGRDESSSRMNETSIAQPSLFALQVALAAFWRSKGIEASFVVGHSVGEIAAAYLSGALSFEDACLVAIHRGRTMDLATSRGAMIAVGLSTEDARTWLKGIENRVSIAAINGPTSLTISGCEDAITELESGLVREAVFCRRLEVEYAFHSPQMDPVRDELVGAIAGICPKPTSTPMISTVTGDLIDGTELDASYWWDNVRQSVRFSDAMSVLGDQGCAIAIELGPHPVLNYSITECFADQGQRVLALPTLRRDEDDFTRVNETIGSLFCHGYPLPWDQITPAADDPIRLPPLAMNAQSLWSESYESSSTRLALEDDSLLGQRIDGPFTGWENRLDLRVQDELADHRVRDASVFPAAAMIELAAVAAAKISSSDSVSLGRFRIQDACLLSEESPIRLQTIHDAERRQIVLSRCDLDDSQWKPIALADLSGATYCRQRLLDHWDSLLDDEFETVSAERLYEHCGHLGLNYAERFRGVVQARRASNHAVVTVRFDHSVGERDRSMPFGLSPAILDSCFHGMIAADPEFGQGSQRLFLPQKIESIDFFDQLSQSVTAQIRIRRKSPFRMVADIDIFSEDKIHCVAIRGFESVPVGTVAKSATSELLYQYVWRPADKASARPEAGGKKKWLLFADQMGYAAKIRERIPTGEQVILVQHGTVFKRIDEYSFVIDPEDREHYERLLRDVGDGVTDVAYLWGLDAPENVELSQDTLVKSTVLTTTAPLHFVVAWEQAYESDSQTSIARLAIVTRCAQPPDESMIPVTVAAGPLIGFGRVVVNECGRLKTKLIDLSSESTQEIGDLAGELLHQNDDEDEVMIRDSIRWVRRFVRADDQPLHPENPLRTEAALRRGPTSSIDDLSFGTRRPRPPHVDEVEIEVITAGLNFSDVMKSLDLYPGLGDGPVAFGAECSGRVRRVGADVTEFSVGDEVIAVARGAFGSTVHVNRHLVARKPTRLSHAEAATIPIAFLTAQYALDECARVRSGERVLVHAASGGVGIAALQLAKIAGAKVFGTAGTDEKREFLRSQEIDLVMNSRSLDFARQTLEATGGEGVDVVLNSLAGEAIPKGLSILRTGGRFLEIGKRDIYADASLGLEPLKNNLALFAIDLDQLFREQPERMGKLLRDLVERFERNELTPLPYEMFDADDIRDAFRHMQQGKHIGKVILDFRAGPSQVFDDELESLELKPDRTYWIAGGMGGFGLGVAQWMVDRGAKHVVIGGRSKRVSEDAAALMARCEKLGVTLSHLPVDLNSKESVESVLRQIDEECPPLAGVFHTAMVLEDHLLVDLDEDSLRRVLGPKVLGGWNLHAATDEYDLDLFVLFSSLSSVFGHAGQANYAAANAFLDSIAHYRRALGMPALAINWGHLGGVGYLARQDELSRRLERQGVLSFSADEAMECLEKMIETDAVQRSVLRMDWTRWRGLGITGEVAPKFAHLIRRDVESVQSDRQLATPEEVRKASPEDRSAMITQLIGTKASMLLGIDASELPWDRPLLEMGLDSLMAVELRNWIERRLEIDFPIADLMRGEGLRDICHRIHQIIDHDHSECSADAAESMLERLPEMSDQEVDALLAQMLNQSDGE